MEILHIKKDEALYFQQKDTDNIYFIISGKFESSKKLIR
jgi:CRP-like cAMP-binding protein